MKGSHVLAALTLLSILSVTGCVIAVRETETVSTTTSCAAPLHVRASWKQDGEILSFDVGDTSVQPGDLPSLVAEVGAGRPVIADAGNYRDQVRIKRALLDAGFKHVTLAAATGADKPSK